MMKKESLDCIQVFHSVMSHPFVGVTQQYLRIAHWGQRLININRTSFEICLRDRAGARLGQVVSYFLYILDSQAAK